MIRKHAGFPQRGNPAPIQASLSSPFWRGTMLAQPCSRFSYHSAFAYALFFITPSGPLEGQLGKAQSSMVASAIPQNLYPEWRMASKILWGTNPSPKTLCSLFYNSVWFHRRTTWEGSIFNGRFGYPPKPLQLKKNTYGTGWTVDFFSILDKNLNGRLLWKISSNLFSFFSPLLLYSWLDFIWVKKKSDQKFLIFRKSKRESNFLNISNLNS